MKQKKRIAVLTAILLIAATLLGCSTTTGTPDSAAATPDPEASADAFAQATAERVMEEPDGIKGQRIFEAMNGVLIAADYPAVDKSEAISQDLQRYAETAVAAFREEAQLAQEENKKETVVCEMTMPYKPYVVAGGSGDGILSVQFTKNESAGKINRANHVDAFVYDTASETRLHVFDLFDSSQDYLTVLSNAVRDRLEAGGVAHLQDDIDLYNAGTAPEVQNYSNFVITPEQNIIFYFNKNTVAPAAADLLSVTIPLAELEGILSENYRNLLLGAPEPEATPDTGDPLDPDAVPVDPTEVTVFPTGDEYMLPGSIDGLDIYTQKFVALTFDDGPAPSTPAILDLLAQNDIKATFFIVGNRIVDYKDAFTRTWQEGHEIATHSWDHSSNDLKWTLDEINAQTGQTNDAIQEITGLRTIIDRPTEGAINKDIATSIGRPQILWSVDTLDWKSRDPQAILEETKNQVRDGSVILMHDLHETTIQGTALVIAELKSQGYTFVTVSQMMQIAAARGADVGYIFSQAPTAEQAMVPPPTEVEGTEPEESAA